MPRFAIGIDLGTTNSALAFAPLEGEAAAVEDYAIPQLAAPGEVDRRDTLPSFCYLAAAGEFAGAALRLPWQRHDPELAVGVLAREQGALTPGRLIASAKSWLCHAGVNRLAPLLPWQGPPDVQRLSPVEASAQYLRHLREAWNHGHPEDPIEQQEVVLTVPASFDETARRLTLQAAAAAGIPNPTLLEEPQAAFYAWLSRHGDEPGELHPDETILVCDVGGGTSDFTLIRATPAPGDRLAFQRVGVGDHLILGGDNLDLALAHFVEEKLGHALPARAWGVLVRQCMRAKEILLGADAPADYVLNLPGSGSKLIGGGSRVTLERGEVLRLLLDGFMPAVPAEVQPAKRASGFQEFGLPFAPDPGITRYLVAFLRAHAAGAPFQANGLCVPQTVLLNGGFFEAATMRDRLMEVLCSWRPTSLPPPRLLANDRLDLAVARGAAFFGLARRGRGPRIQSLLPRSYFLGIETPSGESHKLLCVASHGMQEGQRISLSQPVLELLIRRPAEFPLHVSHFRTSDRPGDLVEWQEDQFTALAALRATIKSGRSKTEGRVPITVASVLNEIGTLDLYCREVGGAREWRMEFDVRAAGPAADATAPAAGPVEDEARVGQGAELIRRAFHETGPEHSPVQLMARLEELAGAPRLEWPPALLRRWWEVSMPCAGARAHSVEHETRWLNMSGFCLRPGFGVPLDDWRIEQAWKLFAERPAHSRNEWCRAEWWIFWRRIAGGLSEGQQKTLAEPLLAELKGKRGKNAGGPRFDAGPHESAERWRLLGALELLPFRTRMDLGQRLLRAIEQEGPSAGNGAALWTLGRLGGRQPAYAPLNLVLPQETVEEWLGRLAPGLEGKMDESHLFSLVLLARRTGDRYRDVSEECRAQVLRLLEQHQAPPHYLSLLEKPSLLDDRENAMLLGDRLPRGLRLLTAGS